MKPQTKFILSQYFSNYKRSTWTKEYTQRALGKLLDRMLLTPEEHKETLKYLDSL